MVVLDDKTYHHNLALTASYKRTLQDLQGHLEWLLEKVETFEACFHALTAERERERSDKEYWQNAYERVVQDHRTVRSEGREPARTEARLTQEFIAVRRQIEQSCQRARDLCRVALLVIEAARGLRGESTRGRAQRQGQRAMTPIAKGLPVHT
jgi:hypothetical protein